jgi:hypothetical protein
VVKKVNRRRHLWKPKARPGLKRRVQWAVLANFHAEVLFQRTFSLFLSEFVLLFFRGNIASFKKEAVFP